jgi:hypothetical protein
VRRAHQGLSWVVGAVPRGGREILSQRLRHLRVTESEAWITTRAAPEWLTGAPAARAALVCASLIAAGVVMLLLNRYAVLFWPHRHVADRADRLLRRGRTCLVHCH